MENKARKRYSGSSECPRVPEPAWCPSWLCRSLTESLEFCRVLSAELRARHEVSHKARQRQELLVGKEAFQASSHHSSSAVAHRACLQRNLPGVLWIMSRMESTPISLASLRLISNVPHAFAAGGAAAAIHTTWSRGNGGSDNNLLLGMLLMRICKFKFYYCCWERCRYCCYYRCYLSLFLVPPPQLVAEPRHISVVQLDAWASLILRYLQNQLMVKPT